MLDQSIRIKVTARRGLALSFSVDRLVRYTTSVSLNLEIKFSAYVVHGTYLDVFA